MVNQLPLLCPHLLVLVLGRLLILPLEKILTNVENPSSQDIAASPISNDPSSDLCFKIMSRWMKECFDSHSLCSKDSNGPLAVSHEKRLPTRVIDVGHEGPEVFLLVTKGQTGLWVTLSHCVSTASLPSTSTQDSCGHLMARTSKSRLWLRLSSGFHIRFYLFPELTYRSYSGVMRLFYRPNHPHWRNILPGFCSRTYH